MPATKADDKEPTEAIVAMPKIKHRRKMRKPARPPRNSRRAKRSARPKPMAFCSLMRLSRHLDFAVAHAHHLVATLRQFAVMGNQHQSGFAVVGQFDQ